MPQKKKLIVNALPLTYVQTGIGRYLRCLYQAIEKKYNQDLEICYFDGKNIARKMPEGPGNLKTWSKLAGIFWRLPTYPALCIRIFLHKKMEQRFHSLSQGFNLYHEAGFFPFKTPPGVCQILTVHDLSLFRYPEHHPKERVLLNRLFWQKRVKQVNRFLAVSEFTQKELMELADTDGEQIAVTPLAHDSAVFSPKRKEEIKKFLRNKGLPKDYFLFVGSGDTRKNMQLIPKALDSAGLKTPLILAGWSGWSKKRLPANTVSAGYVTDQELALLYSGAKATILPSLYEGFGLPVLEAMACGCPAVVANRASLPEVAGEAGIYIDDLADSKELGEKLLLISRNRGLSKELEQKGLLRAKRFSWEKTADLTVEAFFKVLL